MKGMSVSPTRKISVALKGNRHLMYFYICKPHMTILNIYVWFFLLKELKTPPYYFCSILNLFNSKMFSARKSTTTGCPLHQTVIASSIFYNFNLAPKVHIWKRIGAFDYWILLTSEKSYEARTERPYSLHYKFLACASVSYCTFLFLTLIL